VIFDLFADVQPTTLDPEASEDSETLNISGSDVGVPIIDLLNWITVSGSYVAVGTVVFPGSTAQVCVDDGVTGTVEPDFSDVIGETTPDGSATWASLGVATPTETRWTGRGVSHVPPGSIILPQRPLYTTWFDFTQAGRATFPVTGVAASIGVIIQASNGSFQVCTQNGTTNTVEVEPAFLTTWDHLPLRGHRSGPAWA